MSFCTRITPSWQWTVMHWEGNRSDGSTVGSLMGPSSTYWIPQPSCSQVTITMVAIPSKVKTTTAKAHNTETRREKHWQQLSWLQSRNTLTVCLTFKSSWHFSWCFAPPLEACTPQETPGHTKTIFTESSPSMWKPYAVAWVPWHSISGNQGCQVKQGKMGKCSQEECRPLWTWFLGNSKLNGIQLFKVQQPPCFLVILPTSVWLPILYLYEPIK